MVGATSSHVLGSLVLDAHRVIRHTSDEDKGARCSSGAKQWGRPVEIASGPTPPAARPGRTGLPRRWGDGSFSSRGWRGWSVKPNGRAAVGVGSRRTDDERDNNLKNERKIATTLAISINVDINKKKLEEI